MGKIITEDELRKRLGHTLSQKEIDDLLEAYLDAKSPSKEPDLKLIAGLMKKDEESKQLQVRFKLSPEQYDALAEHFELPSETANRLVRKALEEYLDTL